MSRARLGLAAVFACLLALAVAPAQASDQPEPGSPAYVARDLRNISDAYGRVTGPGGQLANPAAPSTPHSPERPTRTPASR